MLLQSTGLDRNSAKKIHGLKWGRPMRYDPEPPLSCGRRLSKAVFHKEMEGRRNLFLLESGLLNEPALRTPPAIRSRQPDPVNYVTSRKNATIRHGTTLRQRSPFKQGSICWPDGLRTYNTARHPCKNTEHATSIRTMPRFLDVAAER